MNRQSEDFLLAKNFEHIFEVMIDTLIGGNDKQNLPKELTEQTGTYRAVRYTVRADLLYRRQQILQAFQE